MRALVALATCLLVTACASDGARLSPYVYQTLPPSPGLTIGIVADTQIQTDQAHRPVDWFRGPRADFFVEVAMRPPALNWASRAMLWSQLDQLRAGGAGAVFYLGDGANNGCRDELIGEINADFVEGKVLTSGGILKVLEAYSVKNGAPIFYVLGNHDILGGGNTSNKDARAKLCDDEDASPGANEPLTKFEVMVVVDDFNRRMATRFPAFQYQSSLPERQDLVRRQCYGADTGDSERQQRAWGCYLGAFVRSAQPGAAPVEFMLLDTNDFVDVSESNVLERELEGLRGAMSFTSARNGIPSQTDWFATHAGPAPVRVALSHYDLPGLRKFATPRAPTQRVLNLFVDPAGDARQEAALFISGHTHTAKNKVRVIPILDGKARWRLTELNVGSTTDYGNLAAVVRLSNDTSGKPAIGALAVEADRSACTGVWREVADHHFPNAVLDADRGWEALGVQRVRRDYRHFGPAEHKAVAENLASFAREPLQAVCIGLKAAEAERHVFDRLKQGPR